MKLRQMKKHQSGKIVKVTAEKEVGRRIRDMGLVPGASITIGNRAPLKDPVAIKVSGCVISLRNSEADFIEVALESESESESEAEPEVGAENE